MNEVRLHNTWPEKMAIWRDIRLSARLYPPGLPADLIATIFLTEDRTARLTKTHRGFDGCCSEIVYLSLAAAGTSTSRLDRWRDPDAVDGDVAARNRVRAPIRYKQGRSVR